jgi:subtilase family serine protease
MKTRSQIAYGIAVAVASTAFSDFAFAESIQIGGPVRPGFVRPPTHVNVTPATSVYYSPSQIRHAYGIDQLSATGVGQTIAVVVAYGSPTLQADLNQYCASYGLPATTLTILGSSPTANASWALESALDVQLVHAIAPGAKIVVSVAPSSAVTALLNAIDVAASSGAKVVSMSFGSSEFSGEKTYDTHFNKAGITFLAATGDNGGGVEWPSSSPYVIAVGGTTLTLTSTGARSTETAWSGSAGGKSVYEALPAFQSGWQSLGGRAVPDVAAVGDPNTGVTTYYNGGWYVAGGTSVATPIWAGIVAVSNSLRSSGTLSAGPGAVYAVALGSTTTPYKDNAADVYDVTAGSSTSGKAAGAGWDQVTGLGTPNVNNLAPALSAK